MLEAATQNRTVMAGLDPAIHAFFAAGRTKDVDARDKPGHDE